MPRVAETLPPELLIRVGALAVSPRVLIPVFILLLGVVGLLVWKAPTRYQLTFSANGVVEKVEYNRDQCTIKVAIYEWINLGGDYKIADIPKQSDRYIIQGSGEPCQALPIAMTATNQHISFEAGYAKKQWTFIKNPSAALSCGGLSTNWKPKPES
jgi:hypothetical protein